MGRLTSGAGAPGFLIHGETEMTSNAQDVHQIITICFFFNPKSKIQNLKSDGPIQSGAGTPGFSQLHNFQMKRI
jgi:hypothetical protein